jgi:thiamine transport system ATP-binding protein
LPALDVSALPPDQRAVSFIFQDNNVFAHLDLRKNVAIGVAPALKLDADQRQARRCGAGGSGAQHTRPSQTRRSLGRRAPARGDCPRAGARQAGAAAGRALRGTGARLRRDMLDLVKAMQRARGLTVLMVSHQPEDAEYAATHTAFLEAGRIVALKPTAELLARGLPGLDAYLGDWRSTRR